MARTLRRADLRPAALPALVGASTLLYWLAGRRLHGLWIMPDEATYGLRALDLWRHGHLPLLHGEGAGYGVLYPLLAGFPLVTGKLATGYASLKLLQALVMSLAAAPLYLYGRRIMRPGYALLAGALAVASPLLLYSGLLMTEVLMYPLGALALVGIMRAVETGHLRDQTLAFAAIVAAVLTRAQAVVLVPILAAAVLLDATLARDARRVRAFWPVWLLLAALAAVVAAAPAAFGAYASTLRGHYPAGLAVRLVVDHLSYVVLSLGIFPIMALALLLAEQRGRARADPARAVLATTTVSLVLVVVQVGLFASRYAPHLLGRDLALVPPPICLVFALWLDRGAPRPRVAAGGVALAVFALLALTPWHHLASIEALPDTFDIALLLSVGARHAPTVVAAASLVAVLLLVLLPRRAILLLPALVLALLITGDVVASGRVAYRVSYDQRNLVGIPPDWIDRAATRPVAYVYDGESYWNGVWQVRFWNREVTDVVSLEPSRVPGPMRQQIVAVPADGRLPVRERLLASSDPHRFIGKPIAHLAQNGIPVAGITLWRLDPPARLSLVLRSVLPNGDMSEPGYVTVYDCGGGQLQLTLLPKETRVVTIKLEGRVVQRAEIAGLPYWNGSVSVPPSPSPRVCHFEIGGQTLLGSTRIEFARPQR